MSRAIRYFLNSNLARGWVCWRACWAEQKRKMESMRRSMSHMLNCGSRGLAAWVAMVVGRSSRFSSCEGVSYFIHRQMSSGFLAWRHAARHGLLQPPMGEMGIMARAIRHTLNRELSRAVGCGCRCARPT